MNHTEEFFNFLDNTVTHRAKLVLATKEFLKTVGVDGVHIPYPRVKVEKHLINLRWENATHKMDVDIHGNQAYSWYGRRLGTNDIAGTEVDIDTVITDELKEWILKFKVNI